MLGVVATEDEVPIVVEDVSVNVDMPVGGIILVEDVEVGLVDVEDDVGLVEMVVDEGLVDVLEDDILVDVAVVDGLVDVTDVVLVDVAEEIVITDVFAEVVDVDLEVEVDFALVVAEVNLYKHHAHFVENLAYLKTLIYETWPKLWM